MRDCVEEYSGFYSKRIIYTDDMDDEELEFFNRLIDSINDCLDVSEIVVEQRENTYRSVIYKNWDNDFLRYSFNSDDAWVSVRMYSPLMKEYETDPLFDAQNNKRQLHWRSSIRPMEIELLRDVIVRSCEIFLENNTG